MQMPHHRTVHHQEEIKSNMRKRYLKITAAFIAALILCVGCGKKAEEAAGSTEAEITDETEEMVGMVNPWSDFKTQEEAEKAAGFSFGLPAAIDGSTPDVYRTMNDEIIEVIYLDKNGEEAYRIRKGKGSDDISGDYGEYSKKSDYKTDSGNGEVTAKISGNDDGIMLITFSSGDYSYSFTAGSCVLKKEAAENLVDEILKVN